MLLSVRIIGVQVVGGLGMGKTSLLRLLLETADITPTATIDQQAALDRFLHGPTKCTQSIQTTCIEICKSHFESCFLSLTPLVSILPTDES